MKRCTWKFIFPCKNSHIEKIEREHEKNECLYCSNKAKQT